MKINAFCKKMTVNNVVKKRQNLSSYLMADACLIANIKTLSFSQLIDSIGLSFLLNAKNLLQAFYIECRQEAKETWEENYESSIEKSIMARTFLIFKTKRADNCHRIRHEIPSSTIPILIIMVVMDGSNT